MDSAMLPSSSSGWEIALAKRIALTTFSHSLNFACASLSVGLSFTTWRADARQLRCALVAARVNAGCCSLAAARL